MNDGQIFFWPGGFPGGSSKKNSPDNAGDARDTGLIPGLGRFSGRGNGNPLQYSCLENSADRGAWWARILGVGHNWARAHTCTHTHTHTHTDFVQSLPAICVFFGNDTQVLCLVFHWIVLLLSCQYSLSITDTIFFIRYLICKYFLSFCNLSFCSLDSVFWCTKILILKKFNLSPFLLLLMIFGVRF